jgi:hypothetical protein
MACPNASLAVVSAAVFSGTLVIASLRLCVKKSVFIRG